MAPLSFVSKRPLSLLLVVASIPLPPLQQVDGHAEERVNHLCERQEHEEQVCKEHMDDGEMVVRTGQDRTRIGKGKADKPVEILRKILLCHDETMRRPRVAPAHEVTEQKEKEEKEQKKVVRGDRDLPDRAPESPHDEIEDGQRYCHTDRAGAKHMP